MNSTTHGQTTGNPYTAYTPESAVWEVAQDKGKAAASWVFDGNTTAETYAHVLKGIDEGDPKVLDAYRVPSLNGEFSDEFTEEDLMEEVGWVPHDGTEMRDDLANQYNTEVGTAFWQEVERLCHVQLDPDEDEHPADCDGTAESPHEGFGGQPVTGTCQHPSHGCLESDPSAVLGAPGQIMAPDWGEGK